MNFDKESKSEEFFSLLFFFFFFFFFFFGGGGGGLGGRGSRGKVLDFRPEKICIHLLFVHMLYIKFKFLGQVVL